MAGDEVAVLRQVGCQQVAKTLQAAAGSSRRLHVRALCMPHLRVPLQALIMIDCTGISRLSSAQGLGGIVSSTAAQEGRQLGRPPRYQRRVCSGLNKHMSSDYKSPSMLQS